LQKIRKPQQNHTTFAIHSFMANGPLHRAEELNELAKSDIEAKHYGAAVQKLREAVRLNPDFSSAWQTLGTALALGWACYDPKGKEADEAIAAYRRVLEIDPNATHAHRGLGFVLFDQGRIDAAAAELLRAVELRPDSEESLRTLASILGHKDDLELLDKGQIDGFEFQKRKRAYVPNLTRAFHAIGLMHFQKGRYDKAVDAYKKALTWDPPMTPSYQPYYEHYYVQKVAVAPDLKAAEAALEAVCREHGAAHEKTSVNPAGDEAVGEDEVYRLIRELLHIGPHARGRAKAIGRRLDEIGGLNLMLQAHSEVQRVRGRVDARLLESVWGGVGKWLA
jgi:tetratricopeptide (TPR) repeat protein